MQIEELKQRIVYNVQRSIKPSKGFVVYFLSKAGVIVYIGKSSARGYARRVEAHKQSKDFDRVDVMCVSDSESKTLDVEKGLISMYRPKYNIMHCYTDLTAIDRALSILKEKAPIRSEPNKPSKMFDFVLFSLISVAMVFYVYGSPVISLLLILTAIKFATKGMIPKYIQYKINDDRP